MQARLAVLADAANLTPEGKLNILGEFNLIWAASVPLTWSRMFLVLKLESDPGEASEQRIKIRLIDSDAKPVSENLEGQIRFGPRFRPGVPLCAPVILEFRNAVLPRHGTYEFEVAVGSQVVARIPLHVFPAEQQHAGP